MRLLFFVTLLDKAKFEINPNESDGGCDAEITWEYVLPIELFGHASGGVQKLDNGNYLISTVGDGAVTLEVGNQMIYPEMVWEAKYNLNLGLEPASAWFQLFE